MNHSILSADRATHLKTVAVALMASVAVAVFAMAAHSNVHDTQTARVIKAGKSVTVTSSETVIVH